MSKRAWYGGYSILPKTVPWLRNGVFWTCRPRLSSSFAWELHYGHNSLDQSLSTKDGTSSLWWAWLCVLKYRLQKSAPPGGNAIQPLKPRKYLECGITSSYPPSLFETMSGQILWARNLHSKRNFRSSLWLPLGEGEGGRRRRHTEFLQKQPKHGDAACSAQSCSIAKITAGLCPPYL